MTSPIKPKVVGSGLVALDLVISADPDRPIKAWAGGTCGNVMSILAYMGWRAYPIARLDRDAAATRVAADLDRWGVNLDFVHSGPTTSTPIIIQENRVTRAGVPKHKFSWSCPRCGSWLPSFRPITRNVVETVAPAVDDAAVFFFDRLSRATLVLARRAADHGAFVVFEPSGRSDPKLFAEAINIAHFVKYADQRLSDAGGTMSADSATLLEVQTLGSNGLRFRHRMNSVVSGWRELDAVIAPEVVDTCGSGDWCTAGVLSRIAVEGGAGFRDFSSDDIVNALQYGQSLAAWNCGFEGARGGMYVDAEELIGVADAASHDEAFANLRNPIECPACQTA